MKWLKSLMLSLTRSAIIKAQAFATYLNDTTFSPNNGWIDRFKKRHNIVYNNQSGEADFVDEELVKNWHLKLPTLIENYEAKDIFNADETGLFFNMQPDRTMTFKGERCSDGKKSKERLTILFCTNADGSEKLKPLVIGKSQHLLLGVL
jgi:Tc5 transposase DNA-binding domain/DDE superfamily endonuclease